MRPLFRRRVAISPTTPAGEAEAYREGRVDERRVEARSATAADRATTARDDRRAMADARRRPRRGAPLISLLVLLVVLFGALMLYLAARNGSFAQGGAVIDHSLSQATQPVRRAEDKTGAALETAGQHLQQDAGSSGSP
jgi:hypothetical protein